MICHDCLGAGFDSDTCPYCGSDDVWPEVFEEDFEEEEDEEY